MLQKNLLAAVSLTLISTIFSGCSRSEPVASLDPDKETSAEKDDYTKMSSVKGVAGQGNGLVSPAKTTGPGGLDVATDPATITSTYLSALKSAVTETDNLKTANELLTVEARAATHQANVDVSLPGSENARYIVHQAEYVTNEKNVCHVLTNWNDSIDDESYQYDVTWVLKKETNVGWRIAGMITQGEAPDQTIVFNFEDAADIVSKGAPEPVQTEVANQPGDPIR